MFPVEGLYKLEVGGVSPLVKPPTGKSFRFVRACERARRGEAVWASERRFDSAGRAGGRAKYMLLLWPKPCRVGCPRKMLILHRFYKVVHGQPL